MIAKKREILYCTVISDYSLTSGYFVFCCGRLFFFAWSSLLPSTIPVRISDQCGRAFWGFSSSLSHSGFHVVEQISWKALHIHYTQTTRVAHINFWTDWLTDIDIKQRLAVKGRFLLFLFSYYIYFFYLGTLSELVDSVLIYLDNKFCYFRTNPPSLLESNLNWT